jgi:putative ABC transport system ATP-binding protein
MTTAVFKIHGMDCAEEVATLRSALATLADEPTGNLDQESRRVVLDFFDELHRDGATIVMVTHDAVAAERATTWLHLQAGTLAADAAVFPAEAA